MALVFMLWYSVQVASYLVDSTWVTIARAGWSLVNDASMVLGLRSFIEYECVPWIVRGRTQ
jgi:hypothetical protein